MKAKIIGSICLVLSIVVIVTGGASFAYLNTSASNGEIIEGEVYGFDVSLNLNPIYEATNLVPLEDNLIDIMIAKGTNKCRDNDGFQVCSLYKVTLSNAGDAQVLNGYVKTNASTYTTTNLKYQIFNMQYINVTDVLTVSKTAGNKVFFSQNGNNISSPINTGNNIEYYLVVWLHETGNLQKADEGKTFTGKIGFETIGGNNIEASF